MQKKSKQINWLNTIFLVTTPLVGIIGTILLCSFGMVKWQTWVFFVVYVFVTALAITAGYHRLFSHKAYQAHPVISFLMAMFGSACFEGSVLEWSTDHRNHHRFVDTEKDPYNIHEGFWHAHIGWLIHLDTSKRDFSNVKDLSASRILQFQHKYFKECAIFMGFIFPMLIAALWGNALAGLIIVGALRIAFNHHSTFFINSLCHWSGKRPYSIEQTARDNWMTALVTMGEGFHNFHHQFPLDYRNGIRYFHYDPTKWLIYGLSKIGLAHDLRRMSNAKILSFQLRVQEDALKQKHEKDVAFIQQKVEPLKAHLIALIDKIAELETELATLKKQKFEYMKDKYHTHKEQLSDYLQALKMAQQELSLSLTSWRRLCV